MQSDEIEMRDDNTAMHEVMLQCCIKYESHFYIEFDVQCKRFCTTKASFLRHGKSYQAAAQREVSYFNDDTVYQEENLSGLAMMTP